MQLMNHKLTRSTSLLSRTGYADCGGCVEGASRFDRAMEYVPVEHFSPSVVCSKS